MLELVSVYLDDMDPNWHKEEEATLTDILILMTHGRVHYMLNGETLTVEKGDLLLIRKGVMRAGENAQEGAHQKYSVHFHLNERGHELFADAGTHLRLKARSYDYMKQRFAILTQQWFGQRMYADVICTGIAHELLGGFLQETVESRFTSVKLRLMSEVQNYIAAHYREPIRIEELAQLVDRAPNYVTQSFKEVTGLTPISYMHQVRVHAARDLILNTRMTIREVSDFLGYSDQAHFNRVFKKMMGYPPSSLIREVQRRS
ncbi:AraC family transcriptional regulator [Paenibacillus chondroitinus]|uniref:AraC family transcriptional regulator n=1 Tax=Paenibacillus chondroitinus TaxID=59842 RepID=A0ABU6DHR6_9BACL|nr:MULTISPECIES: AraC family transcriptional regulator [Paenibacillus]MCY9662757.1 AraC family transcriptional regulator [Paenibacillus anseongense]MEB4797284.1 AraC family transcriptional regulator [Paenibacillus chondroitinus]